MLVGAKTEQNTLKYFKAQQEGLALVRGDRQLRPGGPGRGGRERRQLQQ